MSSIDETRRYLLTILKDEHQSDASCQEGVLRTIAEYRAFHGDLLDEGVHLAPFPISIDDQSLQTYIQTLLELSAVVHSDSLASFLTVLDNEKAEEAPPDLEYVQYLLPNIQTPALEPIPRFGSYQQTVDTLLPGWWLVWYLSLHGSTAVDFHIYTITCVDGTEENSKRNSEQELVHHEIFTSQSQQDSTSYFGSYRILSEPTSALLKVTGRSSILSSGGKVFVDCAAIPHQAFTAACTAANDMNLSIKRRRQAPLLSIILDNPGQVKVCVQEEGCVHEKVKARTVTQQENTAANLDKTTAYSDQMRTLEQQVSILEYERDQIKSEFALSRATVKQMKAKLATVESERRVWNVVRAKLQSELSKLSNAFDQEKSEKARSLEELQESRQELQQTNGRLKLLELQSSPSGVASPNSKVAADQISELSSTIRKLETHLQVEATKNRTLQTSIESIEQYAKERVILAKDEAHQTKMEQRQLENQVHQLKEEIRRLRSHPVSKISTVSSNQTLFRKLDDNVANFQHPDPRLNEQLATLKDRHNKLNIMLAQNPSNTKNVQILGMLEKAMRDIVAS